MSVSITTLAAMFAVALSSPAQPAPRFEAASIRRNLSGSTNIRIDISGGRLTIANASLKTLIRNAWSLLGFQLTGGPGWLDKEMYDIVATTGRPEKITPEEFRLLLRNLLAERFALKVHEENREGPMYVLSVAKAGPKMTPDSTDAEPGINTSKRAGKGLMKGTREPISILATNLGNQLGRYVVDRTGLTGAWDWTLEWDLDQTENSTLPSLFTAIQEQLGLKLEGRKGPTPVIVIDSVEKASEN